MKKYGLAILAVCALCSCTRPNAEQRSPADGKPEGFSVSHWSPRTELFMEYPALIAGHTGRFAVHLTRLDNFKPLAAGSVEIRLASAGGTERFSTTGPSRPGIFGVDVKPSAPGAFTMSVLVRSSDLSDTHELGTVTVYAGEASASGHPPGKPQEETIAFLKEQQWSLDFATETVTERTVRPSFTAPAEVQPRAGGQGDVTAPLDGRVAEAVAIPAGRAVAIGEVLARIAPPASTPADLPALQLVRAESENALRFTRRDRERAQRLVDAGASPARRLEEARLAEATAEARLKTAEERIAQYESTREAGAGPAARLFAVRAPISGTVTESRAVTGANVRAGDVLFRLVDAAQVYITASVPESELPRLRTLTGAEWRAGEGSWKPIGRLVSTGRVVDPQARTVPVIYEVDNRDARLAIGQAVTARLFTAAGTTAPAVRESAIVDDAGRPVVFVQVTGEAFARRPLKLGHRQGEYAQVLEGLRPGERVVTRGAYLIRLAALSSQIPAHGHVH